MITKSSEYNHKDPMRNLTQKNIKGVNGAIRNAGFVCSCRGQKQLGEVGKRGNHFILGTISIFQSLSFLFGMKRKKSNVFKTVLKNVCSSPS